MQTEPDAQGDMYHVYIMGGERASIYIGVTHDLARRVGEQEGGHD